LHQPAGSETATVTAGRRAPRGDSLVTLAERHERGWLAWYWEEGLHLLFWRKRGAGVAGAEIGRVPLLARLVGELPQIDLADGRIVLADSRGASLYQWGPFEPSAGAEPSALRWLAYPLDGFTLAYYPGYGGAVLAGSVDLVVGASVGAVALLLLGLAIVLHRERTREAREAEQRVGFVTQVSHELKTPLTNIRLYAELLEGQLDPDDGRAHKHLAVIVAEGQRLSRLIGNILTFSRHQKDGSPLQLQTIALAPVVDQVLAPFLPALEAKGFQIERRGAAARPVRADPDALEQILGNLISNVEKYAAQGRYLGIELAQDEVQTSVRVQDHGPGVPPRDRQRVFEPFVRLGDRLLDATGTGIGLTIARELARRHGGSLELLPAERGAIFELRLPNPKETPR
jgi:signal transduction histidine kinase